MYTSAGACRIQKRVSKCPGAGLTGNCEPPDMGSGDQTLVLCKQSEVLVTSARAPQPLQNLVCGFSGSARKGRKSNDLLHIVKL